MQLLGNAATRQVFKPWEIQDIKPSFVTDIQTTTPEVRTETATGRDGKQDGTERNGDERDGMGTGRERNGMERTERSAEWHRTVGAECRVSFVEW